MFGGTNEVKHHNSIRWIRRFHPRGNCRKSKFGWISFPNPFQQFPAKCPPSENYLSVATTTWTWPHPPLLGTRWARSGQVWGPAAEKCFAPQELRVRHLGWEGICRYIYIYFCVSCIYKCMCIYIHIYIYVCVWWIFLPYLAPSVFSFTVRGKNTFACSGRARRDGPKKPFENTKNALDTDKCRLRRNAEVWLIAALLHDT